MLILLKDTYQRRQYDRTSRTYRKCKKKIECAISYVPIPYAPVYVDGFKSPVSLDAYCTYLETHLPESNHYVSITNSSKKIQQSDLRFDRKLEKTIRTIHRAIEDAIVENRVDELKEFLDKTAFDFDSPIQTSVGGDSPPPRTKTITQMIDQAKELSNPKEIDEERLNTIHDDGYSLLYELTAYKGGIQILQDNPKLVTKISSEALNRLDKSVYSSPAHNLALMNSGMKILIDNPDLVAKFSSETLNHFDRHNHTLLSWIIYKKGGIELLRRNPQLVAKVSPESLNYLHSYEPSLTYKLIIKEDGWKLLEESPRLLGMITPKALATFELRGTKILEDNQALLNMIPVAVLEQVYTINISENGTKTLYKRIFPAGLVSIFTHPVTMTIAAAAIAYCHCYNDPQAPSP